MNHGRLGKSRGGKGVVDAVVMVEGRLEENVYNDIEGDGF